MTIKGSSLLDLEAILFILCLSEVIAFYSLMWILGYLR